MLLVVFTYVAFAIVGTGLPGRTLGGHLAAEMLYLPSAEHALGVQDPNLAIARIASPDRSDIASGAAVETGLGPPAGLALQPAPSRDAAILAHWHSLVIAGLARHDWGRTLPWPDAPVQGAILASWHRSVVLHL